MRCLENNDKQCAMRLIGELVKANCHNGRLVGGEIVNNVRDAFHELWLISDNKNTMRNTIVTQGSRYFEEMDKNCFKRFKMA